MIFHAHEQIFNNIKLLPGTTSWNLDENVLCHTLLFPHAKTCESPIRCSISRPLNTSHFVRFVHNQSTVRDFFFHNTFPREACAAMTVEPVLSKERHSNQQMPCSKKPWFTAYFRHARIEHTLMNYDETSLYYLGKRNQAMTGVVMPHGNSSFVRQHINIQHRILM